MTTSTGSHVAFLATDEESAAVLARLRKDAVPFRPDPDRSREGGINHGCGGRGLHTLDPGGTVLAGFPTKPYGDAP